MRAMAITLFWALALLGCEDQGPLERAGEELDEAVEDARSGGETLQNRVDDAIDDAREASEDAAEELQR